VKPPCLTGNVHLAQFLHYTLEFALELRKQHGKGSGKVAEKCAAEQQGTMRLVDFAAVLRATSTAITTFITLACALGDSGQPSVNANICRVAEIRGFPHKITFGS
jgi:hypothetical protein